MSVRAPKARKHLSADALFRVVRSLFATIPDTRRNEAGITLTDALMAGFAMFSLKCPSLLDFDRQRAEGNLQTIYGLERVPCDSYMRERLDPVVPDSLRPVFSGVFRQLQRGKVLEEMVFLQECYLLALDGTGYFSSNTIHCSSCLETQHRNGSITYSHQLLGAALIHPDRREVIPLMPEAMLKQDGSEKNDCERNAAKRFLAKLRRDHPHLQVIVTEDGLSSNAPHIDTLQAYGCHYILGVKEGDHGYLFAQVHAAEQAGQVQHYTRHDRATGITHRFRFLNHVPLNASHPELRVNFLEYWEIHADHVQHCSWVTDLRVHHANVETLMRGGRARWKIENETFNTLKNQGYHFAHNYGHGTQHLSVVLAMLMMLAFLVDQTQQLCCALFRAAEKKCGSKRVLWERLRALFFAYALTSMRQLLEALVYGFKKAAPQIAFDSS
jgi:Transposase DDE domain